MAGKRRALCVGVNQFKNLPDAALRGCVADTEKMTRVLTEFFGFDSGDITVLTDAQATKLDILRALTEMVEGAKAAKYDYLVFSFSSHGTQVPDVTGDEDDRVDEAFCPHDVVQNGDQWDLEHIITDDEFRDLFAQVPESTLLEVFMDTCHSGTGLRGIDLLPTRRPRFLPPPTPRGFDQVEDKRPHGLSRALLEKGMLHHILWSGCRSDQTSADANIQGNWHGAFTYYYCKHVTDSKNALSRAEILKKVRNDLKEGRYTQIPQLEAEPNNRSGRSNR